MSTRFRQAKPLSLSRLQDFVALDNITAQMPLIEVSRSGAIRIWVAYDYSRTFGTFTEVDRYGCVKTITINPSGRRNEKLVRPAYRKVSRLHKEKGLHPKVENTGGLEGVPKRKKAAVSS